jgi:cytochrome P450
MTVTITETLDAKLAAPDFFLDPYPVYRELRESAPVFWSEVLHSWVLTRFADIIATLREPRLFSSAGRMTALLDQLPSHIRQEMRMVDDHYALTLPFMNPPDHTRVRALVNKSFNTQIVERMRPQIRALVDELLDQALARDRFDVIWDLAYPLPVTVISALLGVPTADRDQFKRWTYEIFAIFSSGRAVEETTKIGKQSLIEARDYLRDLIAERRRQPQDDLISQLIAAEEQGQRLTGEEMLANCVTLYVAGHETTTGLIGNGVVALLRHPEQLAKLRNDPTLIGPAVEEFLRYDGSLQRNWRLATEDIEIGGKKIRKGEMVSQMLGSANRDPAQFTAPDCLDITRRENRHLGFGYGLHFCVGAPLARIETQIAVQTLIQRFPHLELTEARVEWRHDYTFRSLKGLPVNIA